MNTGTFDRGKYRGVVGGGFKDRVSFQQARDQWVVGLVDRYGIVSANQLAARIGYPDTPQGVENAYRLLKRLKDAGEVQLFSQYNVHYAVSFAISLRKHGVKAQFLHRTLEAERRMALDQVIIFEEYRTGETLRAAAKRHDVIFDGFGRIAGRGVGFEDETGSHTVSEMVHKATRHHAQLARLKTLFGVQRIQVVWGLKVWHQVKPLVQGLKASGNNGGMFLVCHHPSTYDLRHTERLITMPLFFSPSDPTPYAFLEGV